MRKLACLLFVVTAITACGKKGPLIYPEMLVPAAPSNISVLQVDKSIKLSFILPSKDLAGRNFADLASVKVFKRDEAAGQSPGCSSCTTDFYLFRTLNLDVLPSEAQRNGSMLMLLDGGVQVGRVYTYRVSAVAKDNQAGAFSVPVATVVVPAPVPPVLQVVSQPTEIHLEFVGLPPREGIIAGYNVYRAQKGVAFPLLPINRNPMAGNRFVDVGMERGVTYVYGVRMLVRLASGGMVESRFSNEVEAKMKDDE